MHLYKRGNVYWVEYETGGKRYRQSCKTGLRDVALTFIRGNQDGGEDADIR